MSASVHRLPDGIAFGVRLTPKGGRPALVRLLASALGVGASKVRIVSGKSARLKRIEVQGDSPALAARLQVVLPRE